LTDTIGACRALWAGGPASFTSATVSFSDIWCEPRSARPGGPPVLFSGTLTPRNIRRVADLGDGWIPIMGEPLEGVASGVETLRKELAAVGRDPATLQVRAPLPLVKGDDGRPDLQRTLAASSEVLATGATSLVLPFGAFVRDEQVIPEWFQRAARALSAAD
jgi:alkanesulfonate monooxygenase SsuD/methylene tetrahydromethanopterin reductase-like flavin-dependent oxidoreductase (luciferase family)